MRAFFVILVFFTSSVQAGVLSPSSREASFVYKASFVTADVTSDPSTLIDNHSAHLFGYMHSPTMVAQFRIDERTGGMAAPKLPHEYRLISDKVISGQRTIRYQATGTLLINKKAYSSLMKTGSLEVTMPDQLDSFYDEKCTDDHYTSLGDFWYFYDPFRPGCEQLQQAPLARKVVIHLQELPEVSSRVSAGFAELRGDNGNGNLVQITTINGFSEGSKESSDEGRNSYEKMNQWFRSQGFQEKILAKYEDRPVIQFEKTITKASGESLVFRVTRLLAETGISKKNVTFAKFFSKAVKEADVVIYAGHSGLGGNLDIESLEEKAGPMQFVGDKKQLFFFDGCSSYSYYLSMFEARKKPGTLQVLTNGLSSYFATESQVGQVLYNHLFAVDKNPTWGEVLKSMEAPLDGDTYMLNVGGL